MLSFDFAFGKVSVLYSFQMVGFLQLAGGTNAHTVDGLKKMGLFQTTSITSNFITFLLSPPPPHFICLSEFYCILLMFPFCYLLPENSKDEILTASLPNALHALIGGIAYGGYARKVGHRYIHGDSIL